MSVEKIISLILIPVALIGFFAFLMVSGPKKIDYSSEEAFSDTLEVSEEIEAMRLKSFESEGQFEELISLRKMSKEDALLLLEAIEFQEAYVKGLPYYSESAKQRLSYLKQRYDQVLSEEIYQLSLEKEMVSQNLYDEANYLAAIEAMEEAITLQRKINESYTLSSLYDINRMAKLDRRLTYLNAYPFYQQILDDEAQVEALKNEEKWIEAANLLTDIIEKQQYLNSEYRSSDLADGLKLNSLKLKQLKFQSTPLHNQINDLENKADALVETGDQSEAAAFYEEAMELQDELNTSFPDSPYSSIDRVNDLRRKNQSAASYSLGERINALNFQIDNDLRRRKLLSAKDKISRIADALQRMDEEFPLSSYNDDGLKLKVKVLNLIRNDIELVQDRIYENLISVPNEPGVRMLKTEVSQALYSTIAGYNPSRFVGELMPVESVNWNEANDFCLRLSWIMGLRVRLPKEHEFRSAIGPLRYIKLEKFVVSNAEEGKLTNLASKEPLGEGFYDLLGNVSEWLFSDGVFENERVKHIGGHFNDRLNTIYSVPVRMVNRNERSRLIGFRFVVE
ncbi:MAG: SUMF1/EgtB/PvdO family nonheme iron enzyme [Verrucomicrobia bacterium]|nr:SUMF1/EgtB/PvdO family nonheme iron enzyme [Verrucomicrobiota bacterium]